ncbi:hypothetical protein ACHAXT_004131 [Thalassiosira profunda]
MFGFSYGRHRAAPAPAAGDGKDSPTDGASADAAKDPGEYWQVKPPTDDLDRLMWGDSCAPPDAPSPKPKYQKDWAPSSPKRSKSRDADDSEDGEGGSDAGEDSADDDRDNIIAALEISAKDMKPPPSPPKNAFDKILLEDIVWKQRSGFGKYSVGIMQHEWEQRRAVLFASGMLRYYSLKRDMEGVKYDPKHATDPDKSPWVYDPEQEPRGEMNLRAPVSLDDDSDFDEGGGESGSGRDRTATSASIGDSFGDGMRRLGNLVHHDKAPNEGGVKVQGRERVSDPGPTPFEIDITRKDNNEMWRFCFQSQSIQREWLRMLKGAASDDGDADSDDNVPGAADGLDDHGFQPGDHIIRWEMLPVLYPIQIHGIVLETGSNCVIIADFGLASYDNRKLTGNLDTLSEDGKDESDMILAAWEKIKPKEKKRLNVIAVTDPKEIRKWSKISYGDRAEEEKKPGYLNQVKSLFVKSSPKNADAKKSIDEEDGEESNDGGQADDAAVGDADAKTFAAEENGHTAQQNETSSESDKASPTSEETEENGGENRGDINQSTPSESSTIEGAPEWFQPGYRPRKRTGSSSSATIPLNEDGQSVFSIDKPEEHASNELPKSDSAKLVLARTHFILENEDLLPAYHVFYSNSECIAVWAKTGRWSTLQAAVYLVSSSVGFGKSATMLTISMAAAHAILIPALAVGGLAVVSAPLLFLRKSQDQWEKTTMRLTNEFWTRAEPDVFVEAIEYWGMI